MICLAWMSSAVLYWAVSRFLARPVERKCYSAEQEDSLRPTLGLKERTIDSSEFSAEGKLVSASTVPHRRGKQFQFSSVPMGHRGDIRDGSAEVLFLSFLRKAIVSRSGKRRLLLDVVYLVFPLPTTVRHPSSKMPRGMLLERLSWCMTCPNHVSLHLLTVTRRDFVGAKGHWSASAPSCWSCAPRGRYEEVCSGIWSGWS